MVKIRNSKLGAEVREPSGFSAPDGLRRSAKTLAPGRCDLPGIFL